MTQVKFLEVDETHKIAYETIGSRQGIPVVFLHGGPGSGYSEASKSFFSANHWFTTFIDQRGCGKSLPNGCVVNNTTDDLVLDIEKIRIKIGVDKWVIFGGSWGSTLALKYTMTFPEKVHALILRGVFLGTKEEIDWFVNDMGMQNFPKTFADLQRIVPKDMNILEYYHNTIFGKDRTKSFDATERWENLERAGIQLSEENIKLKGANAQHTVKKEGTISEIKALNRMRIHLHYLKNNCFLQDGELINNCGILGEKKVFIIQGSDDPICPKKNALKLHSHLKNSEIELIKNTGHDAFSPQLKSALIDALEKVRTELL